MIITSKRGTSITIPKGATPEQIAQIKARADAGYGTDAQKQANKIGKTPAPNSKTPTTPSAPKTNLPDQTKNSVSAAQSYLDNLESQLKPIDLSDAPKIPGQGDVDAVRKSVYDSTYGTETQGLDAKRATDLEQQKQELANRGIPYNPGTNPNDPSNVNNVYARAVGGVNQRYDTLNQNAMNAANTAADSSATSYVNNASTLNDQYLKNKTTDYQSQLDTLAGAGGVLDHLTALYNGDRDAAQRELDRRQALRIAQINKQRSGGSGNSGSGFGVPTVGGSVS